MRDLLLIAGIAVAAILIGAAFFLFGPASFHSDINSALAPSLDAGHGGVTYTVIAKGVKAVAMTDRTNYRITNEDDFTALWNLIYGTQDTPALPRIDFTKYEVLALFDGSHSTSGYQIAADKIQDQDATRTVFVTHTIPGKNCRIVTGQTSPYVVIRVPKTTFSLDHQDMVSTSTCP